jgi:Tol biopolymer transport system component
VADGFAGVLSADGQSLAYSQTGDEPARTVLSIKSLDTDDTQLVSSRSRLQVLRPFPADWAERLVSWSPSGDALYFVENDGADAVRRFRIGASEPDEAYFTTEPGWYVRDLYLSPDGARLAFLAWMGRGFDLHVVPVNSGQDEVVGQLDGRFTGLYLRGWLPDGRLVVTRSGVTHGDNSTDVEILLISRSGAVTVAGALPHAFDATARLDPDGRILYMTGIENGFHNLYTVSLDSRAVRRVTDNALQGVTFSGIAPLPTGGLIVVQNQRKRDVWVIETAPDRVNR